jgi:hypothetical protein
MSPEGCRHLNGNTARIRDLQCLNVRSTQTLVADHWLFLQHYRDDGRARMTAHGRNPDDCKVLFLVSPILGDTAILCWSSGLTSSSSHAIGVPSRIFFYRLSGV